MYEIADPDVPPSTPPLSVDGKRVGKPVAEPSYDIPMPPPVNHSPSKGILHNSDEFSQITDIKYYNEDSRDSLDILKRFFFCYSTFYTQVHEAL